MKMFNEIPQKYEKNLPNLKHEETLYKMWLKC